MRKWKIVRFSLTPKMGMETTGNEGKLTTAILYGVETNSDNAGSYYHVTVRYVDEKSDQILSDRENCIDYKIFNTKNSYDTDKTR